MSSIRATDEEVAKILEVDDTIALTTFIAAAHDLVEEVCEDSDYTEARLTKIENWLAAHFYALRDHDPRGTSSVGGISNSFSSTVGKYLEETEFGQHAMLLDTAGNLAALSSRISSGSKQSGCTATWLGSSD